VHFFLVRLYEEVRGTECAATTREFLRVRYGGEQWGNDLFASRNFRLRVCPTKEFSLLWREGELHLPRRRGDAEQTIPKEKALETEEERARRESRLAGARRFAATWREHFKSEDELAALEPRFNWRVPTGAILGGIIPVIGNRLDYSRWFTIPLIGLAVVASIVVAKRKLLGSWIKNWRTRGHRVIYERPDKPLPKPK